MVIAFPLSVELLYHKKTDANSLLDSVILKHAHALPGVNFLLNLLILIHAFY